MAGVSREATVAAGRARWETALSVCGTRTCRASIVTAISTAARAIDAVKGRKLGLSPREGGGGVGRSWPAKTTTRHRSLATFIGRARS